MNKNLLNMLVCPVTKSKLHFHKESNELISLPARLAYPIKDDIPVMLESEARELDSEEYEKFKGLYLK
ncbi:Trm112 family protein [Gammaproteobacteria bacterium]|nr:Trm112 family protein [Gammaproteobacteria bacterium]